VSASERQAQQYVQAVLERYRQTPAVLGHIRRVDRELALRLYENRVPLYVIDRACVLAAARRVRNNAFSTPLPPIRSLHYFLPVIQEVIQRPPGPRDIDEMRRLLAQRFPRTHTP
jgi:hypothetical protein